MARKFTFKKTAELSTNICLDNDNTPSIINSLGTALPEPTYVKKVLNKKQQQPNIFEHQPICSKNAALPFKKGTPKYIILWYT